MRGTELLFVRHGEHDFMGASALLGDPRFLRPGVKQRQDHGLTPEGKAQAFQTAQRIRKLIPDGAPVALFSSPLRRARESAHPISELMATPVNIMSEIEELRLAPGNPTELWEKARRDVEAKPSPGSESLCELSDRVMAGLERAVVSNAGKKIIFVTHGGVMETIFFSLLRIPVESNIEFGPILSHGAILHFVYDEFLGKSGFRIKI